MEEPDKIIVESTQFRPELYKPNEPIFEEDKSFTSMIINLLELNP